MVHLAYEFGIPPSAVLEESDRMIATMERYLRWRSHESGKRSRRDMR